MAKGYGRGRAKSGGFSANLAKLGGSGRKLSLKTDMRSEHMKPSLGKGHSQAHKRA